MTTRTTRMFWGCVVTRIFWVCVGLACSIWVTVFIPELLDRFGLFRLLGFQAYGILLQFISAGQFALSSVICRDGIVVEIGSKGKCFEFCVTLLSAPLIRLVFGCKRFALIGLVLVSIELQSFRKGFLVLPDVRFCDLLLGTIMQVTTFVAFDNYIYFSQLLILFGAVIVYKYKYYYVPPYEKIKFKEDDEENEESQFEVVDDIENGNHKEDKMESQAFLAVVDDEVKHVEIVTVSS